MQSMNGELPSTQRSDDSNPDDRKRVAPRAIDPSLRDDFEGILITDPAKGESSLWLKTQGAATVICTVCALTVAIYVIGTNQLNYLQLVGVIFVACLIAAFGLTALGKRRANNAENKEAFCDQAANIGAICEDQKKP